MWRRFLNRNGLASFKVKLVGYFLLLALLPLAALFWGFTGIALFVLRKRRPQADRPHAPTTGHGRVDGR